METNDLGHPLCAHLREGSWAMDYILDRLIKQTGDLPKLVKPHDWLKERFDLIRTTCPSFMRPKYFALVVYTAYKAARRAVVEQCSEFVSSGHNLVHNLALCSVQMYGLVKSASISPSKPVASLAAGLPHFTAGWARCWGRDVVSVPLAPYTSSTDRSVHLASRPLLDDGQLHWGSRPHSRFWRHSEARPHP